MSFGFSVGDFLAIIGLACRIRKNLNGAPRQFQEISDEVRSLSIVLQDVEVKASGGELEETQETKLAEIMKSCMQVLTDVETMTTKYKLSDESNVRPHKKIIRTFKMLTWEPAEISDLRDRIASNVMLLNTFLTILSGHTFLETKKGVDRLNIKFDNKERLEILNWLTAMNHVSKQTDLISTRQEGTGQWLIDSTAYQDWLTTPTETLLCSGSPGVGKSICASVVIDNLISTFEGQPETGIAYVYFDYKSKQGLEDILLSLLKQLSQTQSALSKSVITMHDRNVKEEKRPSLEEISEALCSVGKLYGRVFIVMDALDEFRAFDNCQSRLLEKILQIQSRVGFNLFVTSRVTKTTRAAEAFRKGNHLEIRASEADIERYLRANMFRLPDFINRNNTLQEEIIREIVRFADGIFLIAHLFFKSLETIKKTKHLRRALSNLCLGTAENNYASVYETAMERIGNQRKQRQELAIEALMWITCAKKQLRVSELRCAICVEEDDSDVDEECLPEIEDIISACVGLFRIEENGYVHLLHQTTQTYFDQTKDKWFPNAEARIATLCITYLSYKIFECTNCNTDVGRCERDPDCEIELAATTSNNTFCYYAADNWGHHARAAVEIPSRAMEFLLDEAKMTASAQMIWDRRHDFELDIGAYGQDIPSQVTGLHLAAYFGLTEIVSRLLGQRQAVDIRDTMGNSPLIWAIIGSQAAAIELLLERGANANITDIFGDTALIHASREGALTAVQLLIEKGVDVNIANKDDQTALHAAAAGGHQAIVQQLLSHGADINFQAKLNGTALNWALLHDHLGIARILIESGIGIDIQSKNFGSPLRQAADSGFRDIVRLLLQKNANINAIDECRGTALQAAATWGHQEILQILLDHHADINAHPAKLGTPLQIAASNGYVDIVKILLKKKADVNLIGGEFRTALRAASSMGPRKSIQLSLDKDGCIKIQADFARWSGGLDDKLEISRRDYLEIIKCLIDNGADLNAHGNAHGYATALQEASILGYIDVVQILLDNHADPNLYGGRIGQQIGTALQAACAAGHHGIVRLLLKFNADAHIQGGRHGTAIRIASAKGRDDIVQTLLVSTRN